MRDFVIWEPGTPLICAICGIERGGEDPPGPWFRHRPSHRRRIPIYKASPVASAAPVHGWWAVPLGYLEYIQP